MKTLYKGNNFRDISILFLSSFNIHMDVSVASNCRETHMNKAISSMFDYFSKFPILMLSWLQNGDTNYIFKPLFVFNQLFFSFPFFFLTIIFSMIIACSKHTSNARMSALIGEETMMRSAIVQKIAAFQLLDLNRWLRTRWPSFK